MGSKRNAFLFLAFVGVLTVLLSATPILSSTLDIRENDHWEYPVESNPESGYSVSDREQHSPITITGNSQFASMAQENGWPGSGAAGDPYVITGLEIDVGGEWGSCITIEATDVHFQISDCLLKGASIGDGYGEGCGIRLVDVQNGELRNNILPGNQIGIALGTPDQFSASTASSFIVIEGNDLSGSTEGIVVRGSSDNTIEDNTCNGCAFGIQVDHTYDAITEELVRSQRNIIRRNTIGFSSDVGIMVRISDQISITENVIRRGLGKGVSIQDVTNTALSENILLNNKVNAEFGIALSASTVDSNLWSDYDGVDADYDGIGDTPYTGPGFEDHHPRIWLSGYRLPLVIDGDSDLEERALGEGWGGDGSSSNPYVFENYRIEGSSDACVSINRLISKHVAIRSCHLSYGTSGIHIENVNTFVTVEQNTISETDHGVLLQADLSEPYAEPFANIVDNQFTNNGVGVFLSQAGCLMSFNIITGSRGFGVYAENSRNVDISDNRIAESESDGIHLYNVHEFSLSLNNCSANGGHGLVLEDCTGSVDPDGIGWLEQNILSYNEYGLYLGAGTADCGFRGNVVRGRTADAVDHGTGNIFQQNTWWGYTGVDLNNDGIGDTPYAFTGNHDPTPVFPLYWVTAPTDQQMETVEPFIYDLDAESSWPDLTWSINDTRFTVSNDGVIENATPLVEQFYPLEVTVEGGGVLSDTFTLAVVQDIEPPETTADVLGEMGLNGWYTSEVTVTLTAEDYPENTGLGVDYIEYHVEVSADTSGSGSSSSTTIKPATIAPFWQLYDGPILVGDEGAITVYFRAVDLAGNVEDTKSVTFYIDKSAPETSAALAGDFTSTMWYYTDVEVTLTATDAYSGVSSILYSFDGESWIVYTGPFVLTGDGTYTVYYYSIDMAGNVEETKSIGVGIDTEAPETSAGIEGVKGNQQYYLSEVTVTITASDATSGVDSIWYSFDQETWSLYDAPFTVTMEGETVFYYWAIDNAGNEEPIKSTTIVIDTLPPVTTVQLEGESTESGWFTSEVLVTLSATDTESGVEQTAYSFDGEAWLVYDSPFTFSLPGVTTVYYKSIDVAGNTEVTKTVEIRIDGTPPETSIILTGAKGLNEWYISEVEISLIATDAEGSQVVTAYSFDGESWIIYTEPFVISTEGLHIIHYNSTDEAGNVEDTDTETVRIDLTRPEGSIHLMGQEGTSDWYLSDVEVTIIATDSPSGILHVRYSLNNGPWMDYNGPFTITTEGSNCVEWELVDRAGWMLNGSFSASIDKTPPTTSLSYEQISGMGSIVNLTAIDSVSGLAAISYSTDGVTWSTYSEPFLLSEGGIVPVYFNATDVAGNVEEPKMGLVEVDVLPPETSISLDGDLGLDGWYVSDVIVSLSAVDDLMGVDRIAYSFDGLVWIEYSSPFVITDDGLTVIYFNATDLVGNMEDTKTEKVRIDKTAPTTTLTVSPEPYGTDPIFVTTLSEFELEAFDSLPGSGVERTEYRIAEGSWIIYDRPFVMDSIGQYELHYRSIDVAGNEERVQSITIIVNGTSIHYVGETSGVYSDPAHLTATLVDLASQSPIAGATVFFSIGNQVVSAITDSDGSASAVLILEQPAGVYTATALFDEGDVYLASSDQTDFVIHRESAEVYYTGSTVVPSTAESIWLRATVFDDDDGYWGDLTAVYVTFCIYLTTNDELSLLQSVGPYAVEMTSIEGVGTAVGEIPNLTEGEYLVVVILEKEYNSYYEAPDSEGVRVTVFEPTRDFVTGGGWIWDENEQRSHFAFVIRYDKTGVAKGQVVYTYIEGDWLHIVKSRAILGLAIEEEHAFFEATCFIVKLNLRTGCLIWTNEEYRLRIDVWDKGKRGRNDIFQIRILDPNGIVYHENGFDPSGNLGGGNITIHYSGKNQMHCCKRKKRR